MKTQSFASRPSALALSIAPLLVVIACAAQRPPVASAPLSRGATTPPATEAQAGEPTRGTIAISADIRAACGLPDKDALFPFDSATIEAADIKPLDAVARCFTTGPLAGRSMHLVGHADPRGASEYNLALGQRRADSNRRIHRPPGRSVVADRDDFTRRARCNGSRRDRVGTRPSRRRAARRLIRPQDGATREHVMSGGKVPLPPCWRPRSCVPVSARAQRPDGSETGRQRSSLELRRSRSGEPEDPGRKARRRLDDCLAPLGVAPRVGVLVERVLEKRAGRSTAPILDREVRAYGLRERRRS